MTQFQPRSQPVSQPQRAEHAAVLDEVRRTAERFLAELDERPVSHPGASAAADALREPLCEEGAGAASALRELIERGEDAVVASSGPRYFHFVVGGATPAALGADWLTSLYDQIAGGWTNSPLAVRLEEVTLAWMLDLFRLPSSWGGVLVTGAMMANFTGLAAARQWWGERHDVDVSETGLAGLPPIPVLSSGYLHATSYKALALLGIGRRSVSTFARDDAGRLDLGALENRLKSLDGAPSILIANAGEVNAGDFDPVDALADLAEKYGAWLHVDGAFGLFARVSPRTAALAAGVERADSVTVDGHKWLNVPYDCGFALLREPARLPHVFTQSAAYLSENTDARPVFSSRGPESSRRARALPVWATLRAYGRSGVRACIERNLDHAQHLARLVDGAPDLERLAEVPLNIVCFRYVRQGASDAELDQLNERLGEALLEDGRVFAGTTRYCGKTALRPALVNWRTREEDVTLLVDVVRELGARL